MPANARQEWRAPAGVGFVAVVHDQGLPTNERIGHEPPIATVEGVVAIVAEHEVMPRWHDDRAPVVARRVVGGRCPRRTDEVVPLPGEFFTGGIDARLGVPNVLLDHPLTVAN